MIRVSKAKPAPYHRHGVVSWRQWCAIILRLLQNNIAFMVLRAGGVESVLMAGATLMHCTWVSSHDAMVLKHHVGYMPSVHLKA